MSLDTALMGLFPQVLKYGKCDAGMGASTTIIVSADFIGFGDDYFNTKFYLQVILNANSVGNAPEKQIRQITDYTSATGTFTCTAFGANVEANDEILIIHESVEKLAGKTEGSTTYDRTTDSLEAVRDAITALNNISTAQVNTEVDTAFTDYDPPTKAEMDSGHALLATPTNITAGTITTVTNLTNAPSAGDLTATMKASVNTEVDTALNTAVPNTPTGNSLNDILSKLDGANTFDNTTDSLEAIRDKIDTLPTAGAVVSTASATTTGVIVQDGTSGTPNVVSVTSSATANTFGAWAQLDASASADSWISHIAVSEATTIDKSWCIEIGTGGAGAEVTKIRLSCRKVMLSSAGQVPIVVFAIPIPIKVASGTRIAARASDSEAVDNLYYVGLSMYQTLET